MWISDTISAGCTNTFLVQHWCILNYCRLVADLCVSAALHFSTLSAESLLKVYCMCRCSLKNCIIWNRTGKRIYLFRGAPKYPQPQLSHPLTLLFGLLLQRVPNLTVKTYACILLLYSMLYEYTATEQIKTPYQRPFFHLLFIGTVCVKGKFGLICWPFWVLKHVIPLVASTRGPYWSTGKEMKLYSCFMQFYNDTQTIFMFTQSFFQVDYYHLHLKFEFI